MPGGRAQSDEAVRREASDWVALVHDPDTAVDRAAFEHWRAADPRHGDAYARAERAWDHAALLAQTSFGRARNLPERRRWVGGSPIRYAFAAAVVLFVGVTGLMLVGVRPFGRSALPTPTELASHIGEIRKVALADGSVVTLDTDTVLRVAFTAGERRLTLSRGRARFDVAHDAARPFVVLAGSGSVTARGTMFDVSILDGRVDVTLLRGVVEVRNASPRAPSSRPGAVARLDPGQQLSFTAAAPLLSPRPVNAAVGRWPTGMLNFDGTRLGDAIANANRYSSVKIVVADPALNELRVTGAARAGDADGLAMSMGASLGLRIGRNARGDIVLSARTAAPPPK